MSASGKTMPPSLGDSDHSFTVNGKAKVHTDPFAKYTKHGHEGILQLQEAVATVLFTASPETLMSFVDPMVHNFKAVFKSDKQLVIWRKGNAVFIGTFEHHPSMKVFGFEHLVGVAIGYDGSWRVIKSSGNAFCESRWSEVWSGKYRCFGGANRMVAEYEDMVAEKGQRAAMLAAKILDGGFGTAKMQLKTT
ncbi:hypothetical protein C7974DRAFT_442501 [Boeremia exigua]|uniref:uncharacterized protein n=1 Tax=Boeremia exigua TaxID=749465 RepID=UPI001E8D8A2D|nr:uncharacterized protein C7974DRAFT_442501 [Boeremia exigua]KAH6616698.1 hypothetical protein C7974DRAFT_442501 [Boeremia exigua]